MTRRLGVLPVALLMLGGCAGSPPPPGPDPVRLPARPVTLDVTAHDPCTLLTDAQRAGMNLDFGEPGASNYVGWADGDQLCAWSSLPGVPYHEFTAGAAEFGAEHLIGREPARSVAGFAATTGVAADADPRWFCGALVDVAPGRALQVSYDNPEHDIPEMTHAGACDQALKLADALLTTLRAATPASAPAEPR